jgi:hypothetical protein
MDQRATINLVIGGWTYTVAFPSGRQDQDTIVCSGQAHFVVEEDDEVIEKELYLEIMRQSAAAQKSTYLIKDDGIDVSIYVEGGDFSRIVAELKDQSRIRECAASIEFEGPVEPGKGHELTEFHLVLAVEGGSYG